MFFNVRNPDFREITLEHDGQVVLKFAIANGFRNIQNLVQKLKRGKAAYDFVEVMACPSGMFYLFNMLILNHSFIPIYFKVVLMVVPKCDHPLAFPYMN